MIEPSACVRSELTGLSFSADSWFCAGALGGFWRGCELSEGIGWNGRTYEVVQEK